MLAKIRLWLAIAVSLLVAALYAALRVKSKRLTHANDRAAKAEGYIETRERIDDAQIIGDDPAAARRWLRERAGE